MGRPRSGKSSPQALPRATPVASTLTGPRACAGGSAGSHTPPRLPSTLIPVTSGGLKEGNEGPPKTNTFHNKQQKFLKARSRREAERRSGGEGKEMRGPQDQHCAPIARGWQFCRLHLLRDRPSPALCPLFPRGVRLEQARELILPGLW